MNIYRSYEDYMRIDKIWRDVSNVVLKASWRTERMI
jgi:hypothetical protein